jgi:uncharacterized membrane protein
MSDEITTSDEIKNEASDTPEASSISDPIPAQITSVITALQGLPEEKRQPAEAAVYQLYAEVERYTGSIPHPRIVQGYEQMLPGSTDRILTLTENQRAHRIRMESAVIQADIRTQYLGLGAAFIVAVILVVGSMLLLAIGRSLEGLGAALVAAATFVGVFFVNRQLRGAELNARMKQGADTDALRSTMRAAPKALPAVAQAKRQPKAAKRRRRH